MDRSQKIQSIVNKYGEENFYVSFSGGKDSTVLSWLVDYALPDNKIPRVFADTGVELKMARILHIRASGTIRLWSATSFVQRERSTMDKYINATKLINDIKSRCYTSDFGTTLAVGFAITQLENAPEAIVHCKDCEYWSNDIPALKFPEHYGKCDKTYDDEYGDYNITHEEWFCPLGELRC